MKRFRGARRTGVRAAAVCALAAIFAAGAIPARAQTKPQPATAQPAVKKPAGPVEVQGTVLELDKDDLVLDLGTDSGITENLVVELWRPLRLKHPVTGKLITDRFKIGQIQIGQVRPAMSLAKPSGTLSRAAAPGDLVIFTRAPASSSAATSSATTGASPRTSTTAALPETTPEPVYEDAAGAPRAAPTPADPDAQAVADMFEGLKNQNIPARVARYEEFLRAHPESRFRTVIFEETIALKRLLQAPRGASDVRPLPALVNGPGELDAVSGQPLRIAVELTSVTEGAILHLRRRGETLYQPTLMARAGRGYFAATIPSDQITDRDLEYFIEASGGAGAVTLVGGPASPRTIRVEPNPRAKPPLSGIGSIGVLTDFADYNGLALNDYAWQTEGTFGMRFKDLGIRAVRMGFGVFRGVGGTVQELDELHLSPREVGLTYGYVEAEFGIHRYFSLIARTTVGLLDDGVSGGGQLFGRIGNDKGTNLLLGGEVLGGVGLRSIIELQLNTFERFPIVLRTEVTNQPAGFASNTETGVASTVAIGASDVAGRGVVQLGYRVTPDFTVAIRGSFQGRNINHAGPGFGGFVGYTW